MSKNKPRQGFRSGRINGQAATTPIIVAITSSLYRFTNTGKVPFTLKFAEGADGTIEVKKNCSLDLRVAANSRVTVTTANALGIFEIIAADVPGRSGHFDAAESIVISKRRQISTSPVNPTYRIFNGGDNALQTNPAPVVATLATLAAIPKKCSRDVFFSAPELVKVEPALAAPDNDITGAFDIVEPGVDLRSGRFHFKGKTGALEYLIVDFARNETPEDPETRTYRITNSGEESFEIYQGGSTTKVATLAGSQSIDLQIGIGGPNSYLKIKATLNKIAAGIFDNL